MRFMSAFLVLLLSLSALPAMPQDNLLRKVIIDAVDDRNTEDLSFDPGAFGGLYNWQKVFEDLFEQPLFLSAEGEFELAAAESWSYSDDGMVLFINLKPDRLWSDGVPVTAQDYVFAFERIRDPAFASAPAKFITTSIAGFERDSGRPFGVTAETPHRLCIEMTTPYVIGESTLAEPAFSPLPRHKSPPEKIHWSKWPGGVTNGAFMLEGTTVNSVLLRRNPHSPERRKPYFDRVKISILSWQDATEAFLRGEADYLYGIPERQMAWFRDNDVDTQIVGARVFYLALNQKRPELADKRVRRALRMAVDRPRLVKQLFYGLAKPAYSIIPEDIQGYSPDPSLRFDDVEAAFAEARHLMKEAGYGPDKRLKLVISSNHNRQHGNIAEFVRYGWSQIYVDVTLDIEEKDFQKWFARFTAGDFIVGRRSWNVSKPRMDAFMDVCKPLADPRCGHYDDPQYGILLDKAYSESSIDEKRELFREADRMITDADVIVPLFHGVLPVALSDRIDTSELEGRVRQIRSFEMKPKRVQ